MRLTDSVSRELRLFRGRKCVLRGWAPHPEEEKFEVDGEWVLTKMPKVLYLEFANATWRVHGDLEPGVYRLTQVSRTWLLNVKNEAKSTQDGFLCSSRILLNRAHDPGPFIESSVRPAC